MGLVDLSGLGRAGGAAPGGTGLDAAGQPGREPLVTQACVEVEPLGFDTVRVPRVGGSDQRGQVVGILIEDLARPKGGGHVRCCRGLRGEVSVAATVRRRYYAPRLTAHTAFGRTQVEGPDGRRVWPSAGTGDTLPSGAAMAWSAWTAGPRGRNVLSIIGTSG